eukprot:3576552-Rhodomonas_salina.1
MQFPLVDVELDDQGNELQEPMATYWKNTEPQMATASIRRRLTITQGNQAMEQSEHYTQVESPGTAASPARELNNTSIRSKPQADPTRIQLEYSENLTGGYSMVDRNDEKRLTRDGLTTLCLTGATANASPKVQEPQDWDQILTFENLYKRGQLEANRTQDPQPISILS